MKKINNIYTLFTAFFTSTHSIKVFLYCLLFVTKTHTMSKLTFMQPLEDAAWIQQQEAEQLESCSPKILRACECGASCCSYMCYASSICIGGELTFSHNASVEERIIKLASTISCFYAGRLCTSIATEADDCLQKLKKKND